MGSMYDVFKDVELSQEEKLKIPSFVFCRWLSNSPVTIMGANTINYYSDIPVDLQFDMVRSVFKHKKPYIRYPKQYKEQHEDLEVLVKYFNISYEKAKEYKLLIDDDEFKRIKSFYEKKN
jgi:hypothetical protein